MKKTVCISDKFMRVGLNGEERNKAMFDLLNNNINELIRIMEKVKYAKIPEESKWEAIKILFEKQGTASFTALTQALEDKIFKMREKKYGKPFKSLIDQTFDKVQKGKK